MQSIPTTYDGTLFRSRLEAKWATFFNNLGIKWEYEPAWDIVDEVKAKWDPIDGCYIEDEEAAYYGDPIRENDHTIKTGYCPDFYIPRLEIWVEIKPFTPDFTARFKAQRWSLDHDPILILFQTFDIIPANLDVNWMYRAGQLSKGYRWASRDNRVGLTRVGDRLSNEAGYQIVWAYEAARTATFGGPDA